MDRKHMPPVRLSAREYRGFVREDLRGVFTDDFLEDIEAAVARGGGQTIKDSRIRWAAIFRAPHGQALFIKRYRVNNWKERFKYLLWPSKAKKEWDVSLAFRAQGVQIPPPVGMMERRRWGFLEESLYISEAIEDTQPLLDFFRERFSEKDSESQEEKRRIIRLLGEIVRRIHVGGLFHGDLHAGNFLIRESEEGVLYLTDLHRARMGKALSQKRRLWNIAQIFYSLNSLLDRGDKGIFLEAYGGNEPSPFTSQSLLMRVERLAELIKRRHQRSRSRRCLRESTQFTSYRWSGYRVYRNRHVSGDALMEMIDAHREVVQNAPSLLLKDSPKTVVSMVDPPNGMGWRICVKQYRYVTAWSKIKDRFRHSKGKISWIAANELFRRGISTLRPLAYVEKTRFGLLAESFFLMESPADYLEMDRYLLKLFGNGPSGDMVSKKRSFVRHFALCIGGLHRSNIFHSDLKTCNILTRERPGDWDFSFIDLDAVHLGTEVSSRRALKNLVQINCSIPGCLGYADRIRFLKWYLEIHPIPMPKRDLIKAILEESRERGVLYVSPQGDVTEEVFAR
jgi:tRNA A-37 threonylcarbamoyl transferase component Bud32